jgi:hypothetical protein
MDRKSVLSRFNSKWEETDGCWDWKSYRCKKGYGRFKLEGSTKMSHRVAWELYFGPIPEGLHVLHVCDNPSCVNPLHLFLGTNQDNVDDKMAKGRYMNKNMHKSKCPKCGGEFETRYCKGKPYRVCGPCRRAKEKEYRIKNKYVLAQKRVERIKRKKCGEQSKGNTITV